MPLFPLIFLIVLLFIANPAHAAGLPDTGQDKCYDGFSVPIPPNKHGHRGYNDFAADVPSIASDGGTHPRQDCRYGRDPAAAAGALTKTGAGAKGFDYTKIANNGTTLAADAVLGTAADQWACTKDNITGLIWEVKTSTPTDLRYSGHKYTWYSNVATTNGGNAGSPSGTTACQTAGRCDTEKFVADVNALTGADRLCGATGWRMPTQRELFTLVNFGGTTFSIDEDYFPDFNSVFRFWSGSSYVQNLTRAWYVHFSTGATTYAPKTTAYSVRLVRGDPF